jgi:hypothetical protein
MPTLASTAGLYAHCSRKPLSFIGRLPAECEKRVELRLQDRLCFLFFRSGRDRGKRVQPCRIYLRKNRRNAGH